MKTTIVFDTSITGHNLEYIHHLYSGAVRNRARKYIFAIPEAFNDVKGRLEWEEADNVSFYLMSKEELTPTKNNSWYKSYHNSKLLRKILKQHNADKAILVVMAQILPFVFMLPRKVRISGILYFIYLYKWNKLGLYNKFKEILNYLTIRLFKRVEKAYILNDKVACRYLNKIYKTGKFGYVIDPAPEEYKKDPTVTRQALGIEEDATVYLHFGSLAKRKGTLDILEFATRLNKKNYYIFAGKVGNDIRKDFYHRVDELKKEYNIIIFDEFCSFEKIAALCSLSDFLLMPYREVYQSSGLIGYASLYNTPVIANSKGMLGKLVRQFRLGYSIDFSDIESASISIQEIEKKRINVSGEYICTHKVSEFTKTIIN